MENSVKYNQPLGMPEGSIHAIITIMVVAVYLALIGYIVVVAQRTGNPIQAIPVEFSALVTLVVGYFFGKRESSNNQNPERVNPIVVEQKRTEVTMGDSEGAIESKTFRPTDPSDVRTP